MLVLGRKIGEQIVIANGKVEITLLSIKGNQVALGFKAPPDMPVDRKEIHLRKMAELAQKTA